MFKYIWSVWKKITERIGNLQATIIFSILFYILITPFGLIVRFFSDPLRFKQKAGWVDVADNFSDLGKLRKQ